MADSSSTVHEPNLRDETLDRHRAIVSVIEELEAVDWYAQRAEATSDPELRAILEHNGDEEKEHAAMVLEWLRRKDARLDAHLKTYLFSTGSIAEKEDAEEAPEAGAPRAPDGSLGIGSLRVTRPWTA